MITIDVMRSKEGVFNTVFLLVCISDKNMIYAVK